MARAASDEPHCEWYVKVDFACTRARLGPAESAAHHIDEFVSLACSELGERTGELSRGGETAPLHVRNEPSIGLRCVAIVCAPSGRLRPVRAAGRHRLAPGHSEPTSNYALTVSARGASAGAARQRALEPAGPHSAAP